MTSAAERLTAALADRYRIERELGAGGMATVYLAHDVKHDRKVAVKVLKPELSAVIGGARFLAEIKTTANLQHPHILPLHDSGEVDGTVFYVMPYVDGESLRDRLTREKQLPIDDALRIAREVADALHHAHGHGVIHRDIKPENILLHGGHALVADFGIALAASTTGGGRMTETGMSLGTPTYMSPEQAMGEREITARSDVYALGCVLYEMLLGEPPFTGPTAQSIVAKVLSEKPAPMRLRRDRIPPAVEATVLRALEKLPADRFGTLAEFAASLVAPQQSTGVYTPAAAPLKSRFDRRLAFAAGVVGGALLAFSFLRVRPSGATSSTAVSTQLTFNGKVQLPAISPDGDFVAFVEQRCQLFAEVRCAQRLIVQERANPRPVEVLRDVHFFSAPRWTADGRSLVVNISLDSLREGLFVVPRLGGVPRSLGEGGFFDTHATADSVIVVRQRESGAVAHVLSTVTGEGRDTIALGKRRVDGVAWSPDGKLLALVDNYVAITVVKRDGTVPDSILGPFRSTARWTPDGDALLYFRALPVKEDDFERLEVDAEGMLGARTVLLRKVPAILLGEFDLARTVGRLAYLAGVVNLDIWTFDIPPKPAAARQRTSGTTYYSSAGISADGARIYYLRGDARGDNLYQLTLLDSEELLHEGDRPGGLSDVSLSADGRSALFADSDTNGLVLHEFDLVSRRGRGSVPWSHDDGKYSPRWMGARSLIFAPRSGTSIVMMDSISGVRRQLDVPDSLKLTELAISPNKREAAVVVLLIDSTRVLGVTTLDEWRFRELHRFAPGEREGRVTWTNDGWLYVAIMGRQDEPARLARMRVGDARLSPVMTLPIGCTAGAASVALAAPRGVCDRRDARGDVWLADLPGITR